MTSPKTHRVMAAAALLLPLGAMVGVCHARSGRAAYNEHTGAMVTAARYEGYGSVLRVTNPQSGRSVVVTVNDRGPFNGGRILDLSTGAFSALYGGLGRGTGPVSYEVISGRGTDLAFRGGSPRWRHSGGHRRGASRHHRHHRR